MSDYIKREDAIKEANTWSMFGNDNLESRLKRLPSADVVDVVRCKECIFWDKRVTFQNYCTKHDLVSYPDDYCAWGEEQKNE